MELDVLQESVSKEVTDHHRFGRYVNEREIDMSPLSVETLQVNIGKICNQACLHCHVEAGPKRTEEMDRPTAEQVVRVLEMTPEIRNLDITGGAPELNEQFEYLVREGRRLGKHIMVRHNITVQVDGHPVTGESYDHLPEFFAENECEVICSLPYYAEYFTDKQRGRGVFKKSMHGLKALNDVGYGVEGSERELNLIYNPVGAFLPADQESLEADYKRELYDKFGITFNNLFTITNMPIHRFRHDLERRGGLEEYMVKLVNAFNPTAASGVMCRSLINVNYDGRLSDCDFNQMLDLPLDQRGPQTIFEWDRESLLRRQIQFADHCFGCTAGAGSSCGGATA